MTAKPGDATNTSGWFNYWGTAQEESSDGKPTKKGSAWNMASNASEAAKKTAEACDEAKIVMKDVKETCEAVKDVLKNPESFFAAATRGVIAGAFNKEGNKTAATTTNNVTATTTTTETLTTTTTATTSSTSTATTSTTASPPTSPSRTTGPRHGNFLFNYVTDLLKEGITTVTVLILEQVLEQSIGRDLDETDRSFQQEALKNLKKAKEENQSLQEIAKEIGQTLNKYHIIVGGVNALPKDSGNQELAQKVEKN